MPANPGYGWPVITTGTAGVWTNSPACSQDNHSFAKGKPDCRCGAARRAVCPECLREFETEEE